MVKSIRGGKKLNELEGASPVYEFAKNKQPVEPIDESGKIRPTEDEYVKEDREGKPNPFPTYNEHGKIEQPVDDKDEKSDENLEEEK